MTDTKEKVKRTPKNEDSIFKGALGMKLRKRVELRDALNDSIDQELEETKAIVEQMKSQYEDSLKIAHK